MGKKRSANDFLENMNRSSENFQSIGKEQSKQEGRAGLKHIGGYLDAATVEKVAILRARMNVDNSKLIKLAIDDLFKKHEAQKAFSE